MQSSVNLISLNIGVFLPPSLIDACFLSKQSISTVSDQPPNRLTDAGLLTQRIFGSGIRYQPTERMTGAPPGERKHSISVPGNQESLPRESRSLGNENEPACEALVQQLPGTLGMALGTLGHLSGNHEPLSSNPQPLSSNLQDDERRRDLLNELPGELAAREGAVGQRQPLHVIQDLVAELCRHRAFRAEELAVLLAGNPETVRQNYLRPLLRERRLSKTRPDVPNDPEQAYIAVAGPK